MKLFIHFDEQGQVLSVVKVHAHGGTGLNPFVHVERQEHVLELDVSEEVTALHAHEIAEQYVVDVKKRHLRKKVEPQPGKVKSGTAKKKSGKKKPDHRG